MGQKRLRIVNLLAGVARSRMRRKGASAGRAVVELSEEILERLTDLVLVFDLKGRLVYANAPVLKVLDAEMEDLYHLWYRLLADRLELPDLDEGVTRALGDFDRMYRGAPPDLREAKHPPQYAIRIHPTEGGIIALLTPLTPELCRVAVGPARGEVGDPSLLIDTSEQISASVQMVLGASETLMDAEQGMISRLDAVRQIRTEMLRLGRVASDMGELAQMAYEPPKVHSLSLSMADFFDDLGTSFCQLAQERGLTFGLSSDGTLPSHILTDPVRLRQVIWDILAFLMNHNKSGGLDVRVGCTWEDACPPWRVRFLIRDHRPESPENEAWVAHKIPASGLSPRFFADFDGLGTLWARLANQVVTALGGNLLVLCSSDISEGTTPVAQIVGFGLDLDVTYGPSSVRLPEGPWLRQEAAQLLRQVRRPLEGVRILLIDASPGGPLSMVRTLKSDGADLRVVPHGVDGLDAAMIGDWDIVLMDTQMLGGLDGYEAVRHLRQSGFDRPVVALASHASSADRRRAMLSGFSAYLPKPIDRMALIEVIAEQLMRGDRPTTAPAEALPPSGLLH